MEQLSAGLILFVVAAYFLVLLTISYVTGRKADNTDFFIAGRQSPWYLVAFGMIGASLSGVTFISIPGWVSANQFSYMQTVFGYLIGYVVIATVLMPMYYRMNLTSIYTYLEKRFGVESYKTGASFFLLSRVVQASFRLYLVAIVLQKFVMDNYGIPIWVTVFLTILLIWIYTFRGGIKTIVWTDTLQTFCMLAAVILTVVVIGNRLEYSIAELYESVRNSSYSQMFFFEEGWSDKKNFFKQILAGASIAIVMTGLDQDMMQKNLSCRNIGDAQKNMFWFSIVLVFANLLFLTLGALLYIYAEQIGIEIPTKLVDGIVKPDTDLLYPTVALHYMGPTVGIVFILGLIAAAYSSADSALTALTTSFCIDILGFKEEEEGEGSTTQKDQQRTRFLVHIGFSVLLFFIILIFYMINDEAVISQLFTVAGYTYGPLLGLYAFGFMLDRSINDQLVPYICVASPIFTFFINTYSELLFFGYKFSFELLIVNGLLTFFGLFLIPERGEVAEK